MTNKIGWDCSFGRPPGGWLTLPTFANCKYPYHLIMAIISVRMRISTHVLFNYMLMHWLDGHVNLWCFRAMQPIRWPRESLIIRPMRQWLIYLIACQMSSHNHWKKYPCRMQLLYHYFMELHDAQILLLSSFFTLIMGTPKQYRT